MNITRLPVIFLAFSALSLPCSATPEGQTIYTAKHKETAEKLAVQQDELQADTSDLIMGETNEEVIDLLKKCRHAMNDAVDLLENYNTGGPTLAAQSDVDGKSDMASSQEKGVSSPDTAAESRSVPKSTGMSADDMPSEFRKALDAYNRTLQK